jgi:hypothetical protein
MNAHTLSNVSDDVLEVRCDGALLGWVQCVGQVFVTLRGRDLRHAEEVGQSLSLEQALSLLRG